MKFWRVFALALCVATSALAAETPLPTPSPAPSPSAPAPSPAPLPAPGDATLGATVELATRPAAFIEGKANREEVYGRIMGNIAKIRDAVAKAGLKTAGPPLAVFLSADDDGFTFRAMVPLDGPPPTPAPTLPDPVKFGQTPVGKAMKFEHRGEYDDIDSTYDAITAYLDEKGVDAQDVFVEVYLNEPKGSDDPNGEVDIFVLLR